MATAAKSPDAELETNAVNPGWLASKSKSERETLLSRAARTKAVVGAKNGSIHFYGVVRDQHDEPIPGVRVRMDVGGWIYVFPAYFSGKNKDYWAESDSLGRFELKGVRGDTLCVMEAAKEGVDMELKHVPCFNYDPARIAAGDKVPTQDDPAVLHVWISTGRVVVMDNQFNLGLHPSQPVFCDLVARRSYTNWVPNADIKIEITARREQPAVLHGSNESDVQLCTITALDGGIMETDDVFLYEAPEQGYGGVISLTAPRGDRNGFDAWRIPFYFHIRGRFYGSAVFAMDGRLGGNPPYIFAADLRCRLAPSGARILQEATDWDRVAERNMIDRDDLSRKTTRNTTNNLSSGVGNQ